MSEIRKARSHDAQRLAALAESTFRDAFAAANTAADMELHCRASYGEAIQAAEIANPDMVTLLCEREGKLVGFGQLRWRTPPNCVVAEAPGEIQRLYVAREYHGQGVAHDLMGACIAELASRRFDVAWLGVWERNPRAIAFYEKFGFRAVGEHVFPVGNDPQRDIVMARPVVDRGPAGRRQAPENR